MPIKLVCIVFFLTLPARWGAKQDYGPLRLSWKMHYLAKPDYTSPFYALTALVFKYSYHSRIEKNKVTLRFNFSVDVDKKKSWIKYEKIRSAAASNALLKHEQGHVNINYLLMRETEKRLTAQNFGSKSYKFEISEIAADVDSIYNKMQIQYDSETRHGTNGFAQQKWDKVIDRSLEDLK